MSIIILKRRFVDVEVSLPPPVTMSGRYQLVVRDRWGVERRRTRWFDNIILDSGLNRWGTGAVITGAAIGTDATTPNATQTQLLAQTVFTSTVGTGANVSAAGASPYNNTRTIVYRTALGALNGNYSEVGVGWGSNLMFSRALIVDGGGSPTTISVNSDEQLDIAYQLSVYPPLSDWTGSAVIAGTTYNITGRAAQVNSTATPGWGVNIGGAIGPATSISSAAVVYSDVIGVITGTPSGTLSSSTSLAADAYSNNSMTRACVATYGLNQGNVGGIKSTTILWSAGASNAIAQFQYEFDATIPKDNTKTLTLNFSITWARR